MEIVLEGVHKHYGWHKPALRGIDLRIGGGLFGLFGSNGAGKTTLLRILATRIPASKGRVRVDGYDLERKEDRQAVRTRLGYVPQDLDLPQRISGRTFLEYMGLLKGLHDRHTRQAEIERLLTAFNLQTVADKRISTYSGGMQRRLGIAQALLRDPELLIIDDLAAGIDLVEYARLQMLLVEFSYNRTIIFSSHRVEELHRSCQQFAVLEQGRIVSLGEQIASEGSQEYEETW